MLKPGKEGRGLIAGGAVRAVSDLLGVRDIVSKSLGSSNALNLARATVDAFLSLKNNAGTPLLEAVPAEKSAAEASKVVEAPKSEVSKK